MATSFGARLLAAFAVTLLVSAVQGQQAQVYRPDVARAAPSSADARFVEPVSAVTAPGVPTRYPIGVSGPIDGAKIVQAAGIIFSGRVVSVGGREPSPEKNETASEITFQVEHAIRGAIAGQRLTIHEWAGLWNRGERYRVGERVFLFLYPVSKLGFTSPIGGDLGRFAVDGHQRIVMNPLHLSIFAKEPLFNGRTLVPYADFARLVKQIASEN
jgi:hypothetical protein